MTLSTQTRRWLVFFLSLVPLAYWLIRTLQNDLGPEPGKTLVLATGTWAVNFLCLSLCVTPAKQLLGWRFLQAHRRMLGLFCLFYALLHAAAYVLFILGGQWQDLATELRERPFILASLPALLGLLLLGISSHRRVMRSLGAYWQPLHRSVYAVALLVWVHIAWQVRASWADALWYGLALGALLGWRLYAAVLKRQKALG
jgi:methionine sulfoxide reductase heme-binding subunit